MLKMSIKPQLTKRTDLFGDGLLGFALFTQFYRHLPQSITIYRDFTVIVTVWDRD